MGRHRRYNGAMTGTGGGAEFETVIGLEIHVQLATRSKLFCGCSTRFGAPANTQTCPVCLGLPGALPVLNRRSWQLALSVGLALGCRINRRSRFARKNYFYPDLPKGYQISQFDQPLAEDGRFDYLLGSERRSVGIVRLHLEEDAGKSTHSSGATPGAPPRTLIDLNRCGTPLIETVTAPELSSPEEADAFLNALRSTLLYLGVTDANMEEGSLRCDANISVRRRGQVELNPKTELKNLNSFRFVRRALRYERARQEALLRQGQPSKQGTRLWDERANRSVPMRSKEEAHDYRYFPEPDLVPIEVSDPDLAAARQALPELPVARLERFVVQYKLPVGEAAVLVEERRRADYFEELITAGTPPGPASNWVRGPLLRALNERGSAADASGDTMPVPAGQLAELLQHVDTGAISHAVAKKVFARMIETGLAAAAIIAESELVQISDTAELERIVDETLAASPDEVAAFRAGRTQVVGYLMGQVMRASGGAANPQRVQEVLHERLRLRQSVDTVRALDESS